MFDLFLKNKRGQCHESSTLALYDLLYHLGSCFHTTDDERQFPIPKAPISRSSLVASGVD